MDSAHQELTDGNQALKAFVGGLAPTTTEDQLREYFGQFGPLMDVSVMRDKATGRSRGFGFLTYEDMDSLDKCLEVARHELDARTVEVKRAIPRGEVKTIRRKLFVGGVSPTTTSESLREAFSRFGPIAEAQIMKDRMRGRSRGFGFVTFEDDDSILQALGTSEHRVDGKLVDVKRAEPKKRSPGSGMANPLAHNYASPNSSPRGSLAFPSTILGGYPMNFTLLPYPLVSSEYTPSANNLGGYTNPGFADAPAGYLFASPYASPRGSFAIGETDLPTDFAELSMGRRYSHDFASALSSYAATSSDGSPIYGNNSPVLSHSNAHQHPNSAASPQANHNSSSQAQASQQNPQISTQSGGIPSLHLPLQGNSTSSVFQQQPQLVSPRAGTDATAAYGLGPNSYYSLPPQFQQQILQQMQHQMFLQQQQQQQHGGQQQQGQGQAPPAGYASSLSPPITHHHAFHPHPHQHQQQHHHHHQQHRQSGSPTLNSTAGGGSNNGGSAKQSAATTSVDGSSIPNANPASPKLQSHITTLNKEQEKDEAAEAGGAPIVRPEKRTGSIKSTTPVPRTSTPVISAPKQTMISSPSASKLDGKMGVESDSHDHRSASAAGQNVASPVPMNATRSTPQFA